MPVEDPASSDEQERELGFKAQLKKTIWNVIKDWGYEFETKNVRRVLGIPGSQRQYSTFISLVLYDLVQEKKVKVTMPNRTPMRYRVSHP